jgi:hypothetical protein
MALSADARRAAIVDGNRWWPGQFIVRVRVCGIASAQEVTQNVGINCQPPVRVECLHANPGNK